jgi:shikimate dehydrogenase
MSSDALLNGLIDNSISIKTARYAAILGLAPSKGARSPVLWNAAFDAAGADACMLPMDVSAADLPALLAHLRDDERYLGGAVAVPHKQGLLKVLDRLEPEAARIGAVNAVYRDGDGLLVGANTDGAGALSEIIDLCGDRDALAKCQAIVIGLGGAGLAVATYLADQVAQLRVATRNAAVAAEFANRVTAEAIAWPITEAQLGRCDLLVNCTAVGFDGGPEGSPIAIEKLSALPPHAVLYDIIYQPLQTPLRAAATALGLQTRNGLGMNLEQAVIAFAKANPGLLSDAKIRDVMRNV